MNRLKHINVWFIVLLLLQLLVLLLIFYFRVSSPMRNLLTVMNNVEDGKLDIRASVRSRTELGRIGLGLNRMLEKLKMYIHRTYITERKQKEAEMDALKSQIDPHFLYNTLEAIRMSALLAKAPDVGEMIASLSSQFRYSVGRGIDIVTVREEVDNVDNYIRLLKIRYRDKVNLSVQINENILRLRTLRLFLQPIVENAVLHGILKKDEPGWVHLYAEPEEDHYKLIVKDDGVGMTGSQVEELRRLLQDSKEEQPSRPNDESRKVAGIGLKNVHDRIRTYFGESYGIALESGGEGTKVTVTLPYLQK